MLSQVKDVEASLQEAVIGQVEELILKKAAACHTLQQDPPPAVLQSARVLSSLLTVISEPGLSAQLNLNRAIALLAAKRRLKADKAAKGLQGIISSQGGSLFHLIGNSNFER